MPKRAPIKLTPEQKSRLESLEDDVEWLNDEIRRAKLVGMDISDLEERFKKTTSIRKRMLEEYV
ncbi:unnamed protein product [marine sediment metagenome]|uniref:Uncharacterized protein n=1 Tax=marine sediment metagenome TaxID=412755 RepID=X1FUT3_9ZZZZ